MVYLSYLFICVAGFAGPHVTGFENALDILLLSSCAPPPSLGSEKDLQTIIKLHTLLSLRPRFF